MGEMREVTEIALDVKAKSSLRRRRKRRLDGVRSRV